MEFEQLKLSNQLCFPVYAASRLIIREYQPLLDKMGITYPQYLVLMVLWETDGITINEISEKLILNTNTLTPLLKRMQTNGIITRNRSESDERKVIIELTEKGRQLRMEAATIPESLIKNLDNEQLNIEELIDLRDRLNVFINSILAKKTQGKKAI